MMAKIYTTSLKDSRILFVERDCIILPGYTIEGNEITAVDQRANYQMLFTRKPINKTLNTGVTIKIN